MFFKSYTPNPTSKARRVEDDPIVRNGLAITPAQMADMVKKGQPISAQLQAAFNDDGPNSNDWHVGIEDMRFTDASEAWNASQDAKEKIRKYAQTAERLPMSKGGE